MGDQVSGLVAANRDGAERMTKQLGKVVEDQAVQNSELNGAIRTAHESAQQANMATTGQVQQLTTSIQMMLDSQTQRIKKGTRIDYSDMGDEWCLILDALTGPHLVGLCLMVVGIIGDVCVGQPQMAAQLEARVTHSSAFGSLLLQTCLGRAGDVEDCEGEGEGVKPLSEFALPFAVDCSWSPNPSLMLGDDEEHRRTRLPTVFLRGCGSRVVAEWFTGAGTWAGWTTSERGEGGSDGPGGLHAVGRWFGHGAGKGRHLGPREWAGVRVSSGGWART